jgi:hypothetical protein
MKKRIYLTFTAIILSVIIISTIFFNWQLSFTPKFSFGLKFETINYASQEQYGYLWNNKTNTLNFTTTSNSFCQLYFDQFRNIGLTTLHNITVLIDSFPQGLTVGNLNQVNNSSEFTPYSIDLPIEMPCGTLNSSDYRTTMHGWTFQTISTGKYEIPCRLISQEVSIPFNVTINVI